jgi:hypothetical protein
MKPARSGGWSGRAARLTLWQRTFSFVHVSRGRAEDEALAHHFGRVGGAVMFVCCSVYYELHLTVGRRCPCFAMV